MNVTDTLFYKNAPINYQAIGEGPAVVLIHGFLESLEIWKEFTEILSREFTVVSIDLPGHGRSGIAGDTHTIPMMADAILDVCNFLSIETFMICGHSMGGYVALELAARFPLRVSALVLFHSHAAPDDEKARENRDRTINIVKLNHSGFIHQFIGELFAGSNREKLEPAIEKLRNRAASTSPKAIIAALEGMKQRRGALDFLTQTDIPVYFVIGREDSRMPYNKVMAQAMLCKHSETILLHDVGHMGFLEAPGRIFPAVQGFLRRNKPLFSPGDPVAE
ncbi:MAG: alpha/beta hydrolase [Lentimicrobium sp.]|jgi:pimeloyl-ACP methyl ester carboxylesterase|nr:alpha/beta hydrolase [Lentimicrobium sp.]MDD2526974.1 alpha/beta hydrolase [Lentimicrobiaceae bacterium]MDD4597830.1 alpha/beta hydrolase [Lentimicrobiaceae bacterium]MDY0024988.1 alpha/beta hydrolase [Lentimicrobium sp.]HAH57726.1 alpha/beta hydrolase [Bacteroidales bacterium]